LNPALRRIGSYLGITLLTYPVIYLLTVLSIIAIGSRESGMYLGGWSGLGVTWLVYPMVFWRPFTLKKILLALAVLALSYGFLIGAGTLDLHLIHDSYGLYDLILFYSLPCMALFELVTHLWGPKPFDSVGS
jgi:hypothetical protein